MKLEKESQFNFDLKGRTNKELLEFLNRNLQVATTEKRLYVTLKNVITKPIKREYFIELDIDKYWDDPKSYFEIERRKIKAISNTNNLSEKFKDKFDLFLIKSVDDTYLDASPEERETITTQKWREILLSYFLSTKIYPKLLKGRKTPGAPLKTNLRIFIKLLNLILRTLRVNRRKSVITPTHLDAISYFFLGYLKARKYPATIRQDLYR